VLWDDGTVDKCRYGVGEVSDVIPAKMSTGRKEGMRVGAIVERGRDLRHQL